MPLEVQFYELTTNGWSVSDKMYTTLFLITLESTNLIKQLGFIREQDLILYLLRSF